MRSVLEQSYRDLELVVVDDNSPDRTEAIVRSFGDPRVRYVRNAGNLGPEGNWNRCLALARGKYFKLMPHDDLLRPGSLARQVAVLEADSTQTIALVCCAREVIGSGDRVLVRRGYPGGREGPLDALQVLRQCVRRGTNVIGEPGGVLFRRALAERVGSFDATNPYVIDLDYWTRLLAHGNAYYQAEVGVAFRVSEQQWTVAIGQQQSRQFSDFIEHKNIAYRRGVTNLDRACGKITPILNQLARWIFYRLFVR
jgi:glycosyltransferase involved in cell wall biosynthesis